MKNLTDLIEMKKIIEKEIKKEERHRLSYIFLNFLEPSAIPNLAGAIQLASYFGIIINTILLIAGVHLLENPISTYAGLGFSSILATAFTIAAYKCYNDTYLNKKRNELLKIEDKINNYNYNKSKSNKKKKNKSIVDNCKENIEELNLNNLTKEQLKELKEILRDNYITDLTDLKSKLVETTRPKMTTNGKQKTIERYHKGW